MHVYDCLCKQREIEHRLITPRHTRTNAMAASAKYSIKLVLRNYVKIYNHNIPQWPTPTSSDTFDRYDVPIGGIIWHVKDGCFQKSLSARQSS